MIAALSPALPWLLIGSPSPLTLSSASSVACTTQKPEATSMPNGEDYPLSIQCQGGRLHEVCPGRSVWWEENEMARKDKWGRGGEKSRPCECECHAGTAR